MKEKYLDLWSYWNWFFFRLFFKYTRFKTWRNSEMWLLSPSSLFYLTTYRPEKRLLSDLWWASWCCLQNSKEIPCFYMERWGKGGDGSREGIHTRRKKNWTNISFVHRAGLKLLFPVEHRHKSLDNLQNL